MLDDDPPGDGWAVTCLCGDGRPVTAAEGLVPGARHCVAGAPPLDVRLHPGGRGTRPPV